MTHIDLNDPKWQTAPNTVWGPAWWSEFHEVLEKVPCSVCQPKAVKDGHAFHDVKNAELGKRIYYPSDLVAYSRKVEKAVQELHSRSQCGPGHPSGSCPRMAAHPSVNE
jgi:hypothetical protein